MVDDNYNPSKRMDAYEAELNRLVKKIDFGSLRAFTDEENLYMAQQMSEGMEEFLLAQRKREVESALELKTIILNS
jgi:hypothetical protein